MASEEERPNMQEVSDRASEVVDPGVRTKVKVKVVETRCNPGIPTQLNPKLPDRVWERLEELKIRQMASEDMKLTSLHYRQTCSELLKRYVFDENKNQIELKINDDTSAWISPGVVQHVLDMPEGSVMEFEVADDKVRDDEFDKMVYAVSLALEKYPQQDKGKGKHNRKRADIAQSTQGVPSTQGAPSTQAAPSTTDFKKIMKVENIAWLFEHCDKEDIKDHAPTDRLVRLYLATVHDRMFLPGTNSYVSKAAVANIYHLETLCKLNWAHLVFNSLKKACLAQDESYMKCCVAVFLIVFVDCIEENPVGKELPRRIQQYTHLEDGIKTDIGAGHDGADLFHDA